MMEAPRPKKSSSKKNKKSWRLNSEVGDVEDFLEDRRLEERLGGSFDARDDLELFVVDHAVPKEEPKEAKGKPLKCFSSLENHSAISDPIKVRNRVRTPAERENPLMKHLRKKDKLKDKIGRIHRESHEIKKKAKPVAVRRMEFDFDLWGKGECPEILKNEWIERDSKKQALGNSIVKAPKSVNDKTSELPAVELPVGGASYNPSLKDHKEHLWRTAITEINKERAIRRIEKHTTDMFPSRRKTREEEFKELAQGLAGLDPEVDNEPEEEEGEEVNTNEPSTPVTPKPKTKKQRKKQRSSKAAEKRKLLYNAKLNKERSVFRVKTFKKELDKFDNEIEEKSKKRLEQKETRRKFQPLQLSRHKFEEMEEPVKLTEELTGNLRTLKPEGNLLEERYNSMQKRNIVETRVPAKKIRKPAGMKSRKRKVEKRSYKMGWEKK